MKYVVILDDGTDVHLEADHWETVDGSLVLYRVDEWGEYVPFRAIERYVWIYPDDEDRFGVGTAGVVDAGSDGKE